MKNFLHFYILDNKKDKGSKTNLIYIKKININEIKSIISFL